MRTKTRRDSAQITNAEHHEELDAKRVFIVGGAEIELDVDSDKIVEAIKESLQNLQLPEIKMPEITTLSKGSDVKTVEVPVIVPEIRVLEVERPIVTKEVQIVEVEKPVIIKEIEIKTVEVPTITKEIEYKLHPMYMIIMSILTVSLVGCLMKLQGVI